MRNQFRYLSLGLFFAPLAILQGCWQQPVGSEAEKPSENASRGAVALSIGSPDPVPTNIWTLNQLNTTVRNNPTGNFRLTAHIDMGPAASWDGGKGWTPISNFQGTFDGNSFQIRNLTMNRPQQWGVGLFESANQAILRNVGLTNVSIQGNGWVGGLAGMITGSQVVSSYVEGTVTAGINQFGPGFNIGLFAGTISSSDVGRSYSRGTVTGAATLLGGFAGIIDDNGGDRSVIHECYARVDVTPNSTASTVWAGGFAAQFVSSTALNLYAMGNNSNIVRGRDYVGGLFGEVAGQNIIFDFCYSRNTVTDWSVPSKAGTYGVLTGAASHIASLFWDKTVDGGTSSAPVGQAGFTTTTLKNPTSTSQYPYDNGTDADWDAAEWNPGTNAQYNILRNVVRASLQTAI
jgi:M26 IgA1-specific metallo-endopeptidase-like protein